MKAEQTVTPSKDTLEPVMDLGSLVMHQPSRPLVSDLSKPGSTGSLVNKLAQLGQKSGGGSVASTATRALPTGSAATSTASSTVFKVNGLNTLTQSPINIVGDNVTIEANNPLVGNVELSVISAGFEQITDGVNSGAIMLVAEGGAIGLDMSDPGAISANYLWDIPVSGAEPLNGDLLGYNASLDVWQPVPPPVSNILTLSVTLTAADLATASSEVTQPVIIPAPGVGKAIVLTGVLYQCIQSVTFQPTAIMFVSYGTVYNVNAIDGGWDNSIVAITAGNTWQAQIGNESFPTTSMDNAAIGMAINAGAVTGGSGPAMTVFVTYYIITLS